MIKLYNGRLKARLDYLAEVAKEEGVPLSQKSKAQFLKFISKVAWKYPAVVLDPSGNICSRWENADELLELEWQGRGIRYLLFVKNGDKMLRLCDNISIRNLPKLLKQYNVCWMFDL